MAIKRALVVDDSKSARLSLKKLLSEHDLHISMAGSGEEALDFLKRESVDVIFMDHTMPGMDGLEAVTAIKANPKTATIPVMMYTTREGEVYVGQARALGAVGVLPKTVEPHQLFEMLLKLGLVQDRRVDRSADSINAESAGLTQQTEADSTPEHSATDRTSQIPARAPQTQLDQQLEYQAVGISVQNLVGRILEDQHVTLRSDILRSQRAFAKDVAREVIREQHERELRLAEQEADELAAQATQIAPAANSKNLRFTAAAAMVLVVVTGFLAWQFKEQRDLAVEQLSVAQDNDVMVEQLSGVQNKLHTFKAQNQNLRDSSNAALQWALNHGNATAMEESAFSPQLAAKVESAIGHLQSIGFRGQIELTSHLGEFCLLVDEQGNYVPAADERRADECDYSGHLFDRSELVQQRVSAKFTQLIQRYGVDMSGDGYLLDDVARVKSVRAGDGITLKLIALTTAESQAKMPYPSSDVSAAQWNKIAQQNNRVQIRLIPEQADLVAQF